MESFTETKDRRVKKEMKYVPKRSGQRSQASADGDVPMKEETEQTQTHQQKPKRGGARASQSNPKHQEEEKNGSVSVSSSVAKDTKAVVRSTHRPSKEEGFTGDKETWFDGKDLSKFQAIDYRYHIQEATNLGSDLLGSETRLLLRQLLSLLHPRGDA